MQCMLLSSGFFAKCLRPVTRLRELEISFFSLFHFTFSSFLCQVVTATANSRCGTASVAHKLHLIGAWIVDHGHGESATRCESVQTHALDNNIVMASGAEWMAGYVFCFLNIIPNWWYKLGLKVLETCALTLSDAMEEKQVCKVAEIITKMSPEHYVESSLMEKQGFFCSIWYYYEWASQANDTTLANNPKRCPSECRRTRCCLHQGPASHSKNDCRGRCWHWKR